MSVKDCHYPWEWMTVGSDGTVRPCCYARPLDNLNERSAEEIWNGVRFQKVRLAIMRDEIHPACRNAPCKYIQHSTECAPFFDEDYYLARYSDVQPAIDRGEYRSARDHYERCGKTENREMCEAPGTNT